MGFSHQDSHHKQAATKASIGHTSGKAYLVGVSGNNFPHDEVYTTLRKEKHGAVSKATKERERW